MFLLKANKDDDGGVMFCTRPMMCVLLCTRPMMCVMLCTRSKSQLLVPITHYYIELKVSYKALELMSIYPGIRCSLACGCIALAHSQKELLGNAREHMDYRSVHVSIRNSNKLEISNATYARPDFSVTNFYQEYMTGRILSLLWITLGPGLQENLLHIDIVECNCDHIGANIEIYVWCQTFAQTPVSA
jgi:hypothetical protein